MTVRLIVFTFAALSLVNAYSFIKLYSSTDVSRNRVIAGGVRRPAAIGPQSEDSFSQFKTHLEMDLNCGVNKKSHDLKVKGQWAQLKGRICSGRKIKTVEITNLKNGFTASVFNLGTQNYQTDLIQLDFGANKIRVKIIPAKGPAEEQTIVIESNTI